MEGGGGRHVASVRGGGSAPRRLRTQAGTPQGRSRESREPRATERRRAVPDIEAMAVGRAQARAVGGGRWAVGGGRAHEDGYPRKRDDYKVQLAPRVSKVGLVVHREAVRNHLR